MGLYCRYVLPRIIDAAMQIGPLQTERAALVPRAAGEVLEVGIGSGANLSHYGPDVRRLYGLDPSPELWSMARGRVDRVSFPVQFVEGSAESIPLSDDSFDTVVITCTLCSIPRPLTALKEMGRVLRPHGQILFIEHGRSPDSGVAGWQDRLNPIWKRLGGGCNLNRRIDDLIRQAGLRIIRLETGYVSGPKPFTYLYRGLACGGDGRVESTEARGSVAG